jgi:hypothetical protein
MAAELIRGGGHPGPLGICSMSGPCSGRWIRVGLMALFQPHCVAITLSGPCARRRAPCFGRLRSMDAIRLTGGYGRRLAFWRLIAERTHAASGLPAPEPSLRSRDEGLYGQTVRTFANPQSPVSPSRWRGFPLFCGDVSWTCPGRLGSLLRCPAA